MVVLSVQDARALGYLLELIAQEQQEEIRARLGVRPPLPGREAELNHLRLVQYLLPPSIHWWLLSRDDPDINALVVTASHLGDAVRRDILDGVPFGPGGLDRLPLTESVRVRRRDPYFMDTFDFPFARDARDLLPLLRQAGSARRLRTARRTCQ